MIKDKKRTPRKYGDIYNETNETENEKIFLAENGVENR
jgi:hypothetical protein